MTYLDIAAILCIGLMIGAEFAVSVFLNPVVWKLDNHAQVRTIRLFAARLGKAMPFWYALSLLFLISETILRRHQPGFASLLAASAIWAAVIVLTIVFLVPINNRLAQMGINAHATRALREHHRWDTLHRARIAALAVAMFTFLIAIRV
jgi:uncharacterized membrane protein